MMFRTLLEKELKAILLSPKFAATFAACSILILLSLFIGIQDYRASVRQYETATRLAEQQMREQSSWGNLNNRVFRQPDPMQIFVSGVNNDIGRFSMINSFQSVKLRNSIYSDDPIFAVFRFVDLTFIFQVVLSLFAILFTYDAINGERESGTLRLTFANAISRAQYLLAKYLGSLLALVVPLFIPLLLGALLVLVFQVPMATADWARLIVWLGISLLFFAFFIAFGLLISSLTKRSSVSFLISLVGWVLFVLIIPRAAVMAAGQIVTVPSVAEIEGQQDGFAKQRWERYKEELMNRWQERQAEMEGMTPDEREVYRDDHMWNWMQDDDKSRKAVQRDINTQSRKIHEDLRNRIAVQERLAFSLTRVSPASAYNLAAMNLAGTDVGLKPRYEEPMRNYRDDFTRFVEKKQEETGSSGGIRVTFDSEKGFDFKIDRGAGTLDLTDLPRFVAQKRSLRETIAPTIFDFGLLCLYTILAFAGSIVAFLRYDLR